MNPRRRRINRQTRKDRVRRRRAWLGVTIEFAGQTFIGCEAVEISRGVHVVARGVR
jgi:hypothetical protein